MQPPPRGCVLKPDFALSLVTMAILQPPPRGCVLKLDSIHTFNPNELQPPPRGCVLKR